MNWKQLFDEGSLEAGFELYMAKAVKRLSMDDDRYYAEVKGSFVEISINKDGSIGKALVDGSGEHPEYVAAVMYEVTDPVVQNAYLQDVLDMLDRSTESDLREFIEDLIVRKPSLAYEARRWFGEVYADMESLEDELESIFAGYDLDWLTDGAIDALLSDLEGFIKTYMPSLAASERYDNIADILLEIENRLTDYEADPSLIEQAITKLLSTLTALCMENGDEGRSAIFTSLLELSAGRAFEFTDVVEGFLIDTFNAEDEIKELLSYVQDELDIIWDIVPRQRYVLYKSQLLEKSGLSEKEVKERMGSDWDQPVMIVRRGHQLFSEGLNDEAVNLLLAAHDRAKEQYARGAISKELLSIYKALGRKEDEVKELVRFLSFYHFSLELAGRLREITDDDEWAEAKATVAETLGLDERLEFYQWDDDKASLLDELQRNGSVEDIWGYAEYLLPDYSREVAELASSRVVRELEKAESHSDYHYLGAFFREMSDLMPEERPLFWQAYGLISEMYPRNSALRQELRATFKGLREL